jgi:hypothetical protein
MPVILATQGRHQPKASPSKQSARLYLENIQQKKRAVGAGQVVEHLPSKREAPSSNTSTSPHPQSHFFFLLNYKQENQLGTPGIL